MDAERCRSSAELMYASSKFPWTGLFYSYTACNSSADDSWSMYSEYTTTKWTCDR